MTNDQLLRTIEQRIAEGRTADLQQLVYCTSDEAQSQVVQDAATTAGCVFSILGPDDDGEATVFVQGSPQELRQCAENVVRSLPDGH